MASLDSLLRRQAADQRELLALETELRALVGLDSNAVSYPQPHKSFNSSKGRSDPRLLLCLRLEYLISSLREVADRIKQQVPAAVEQTPPAPRKPRKRLFNLDEVQNAD